jgi:hypothetical protein
MKVFKQLLSFFLTALSVSVSGEKPEISRVRDARKAMSIATMILPWATAGLSIGFATYFLTHPHSLNPRRESISSGFFGRQTVWPFISSMTLMAGVGFVGAVVLPNRYFGKYFSTICKT